MGGIFPKVSYPYSQSTPKNGFYFWSLMGAHYYFYSLKYNNITNNFLNRPLLLVLTCLQFGDTFNVGFEKIINECSFSFIIDSHLHVLFITY